MLIEMEGFQVLLARKHIKNINLRINSQGEIKVSAPFKAPLSHVQRFLQERHDWITVRLHQVFAAPKTAPVRFVSGETHAFLGKPYTLIVQEHAPKNSIVVDGDHIWCSLRNTPTPIERQMLFKRWYRAQMDLLLPDLIHKWEQIIGVTVHSWVVRAMKTRWGSCIPSKKRISINAHLIHKNLGCLEYVIVHELVHMLEASHNARFYKLVSQYMPDWEVYHKQLARAHGG